MTCVLCFFGAEKNLLAKIYCNDVIMLQVSNCYWDQNQITVLSFDECVIQQCCFNCNHHTSGTGMIYMIIWALALGTITK